MLLKKYKKRCSLSPKQWLGTHLRTFSGAQTDQNMMVSQTVLVQEKSPKGVCICASNYRFHICRVEQTEVIEGLCLDPPNSLWLNRHDWDSKKDKIPLYVTKETLKEMKNVKNFNQFVLVSGRTRGGTWQWFTEWSLHVFIQWNSDFYKPLPPNTKVPF